MLTRITRQVSRMFDLNLLYRIGEVCARERFLWGVVCYYSGYCLQVIFREVFCHVYGKIPRHTGAIVAVADNYSRGISICICDYRACSQLFLGNWHLHLWFLVLQSSFSGILASTFAILGLAVNFFWEIGIYICDYRPCSQPFPGNWHLHLQDSRLQSIISGKLASTFVIVGLVVNFSRKISIYICEIRACSQLFPGNYYLHLRFS